MLFRCRYLEWLLSYTVSLYKHLLAFALHHFLPDLFPHAHTTMIAESYAPYWTTLFSVTYVLQNLFPRYTDCACSWFPTAAWAGLSFLHAGGRGWLISKVSVLAGQYSDPLLLAALPFCFHWGPTRHSPFAILIFQRKHNVFLFNMPLFTLGSENCFPFRTKNEQDWVFESPPLCEQQVTALASRRPELFVSL